MMWRETSLSAQLLASPRPPSLRYGIVLLSTGLATSLWLLCGQQLVPTPFLLFTAAVSVMVALLLLAR